MLLHMLVLYFSLASQGLQTDIKQLNESLVLLHTLYYRFKTMPGVKGIEQLEQTDESATVI